MYTKYAIALIVATADLHFIARSDKSAAERRGRRAIATTDELRLWKKASKLEARAVQEMTHGNIPKGLQYYFKACEKRRYANFSLDTALQHPLEGAVGDQSFRRAGRLKLRHDAEQLEYLVAEGHLPAKPYSHLATVYRRLIPKLPTNLHAVDVDPGIHPLFDRGFNRALHLAWPQRLSEKVLSTEFDAADLEQKFVASELPPEIQGCEAQNGVAYADNVLSNDALGALRRWCLESTMWFASRTGYVAAFMQEAFNSPLILQVVEELRQALPSILGSHRLMNMWAFKYANNESDWPLEGTAVHADVAAVNANLWITEDAANEDHRGGGLTIYTKQAPREWGFADYNSVAEVPRIKAYLNDSTRIEVPHRQNRIVIFNSNLFHETQTPHFRSGYKGRRINLTFLFGRRCGGIGGVNEGGGSSESAKLVGSSGKLARGKQQMQQEL